MPTRISVLGFILISLASATQLSAEIICDAVGSVITDVKRRNCWPEPFLGPDRVASRSPFVTQVSNGWRRQNMLGEFHFESATGELTESGRLKVRWILTAGPQQHRLIYVHAAEKEEETAARVAAVRALTAQIAPNEASAVFTTSIPDDGWPADQVDIIDRKYRASTPAPRLPSRPNPGGGSGSSGGGGGLN